MSSAEKAPLLRRAAAVASLRGRRRAALAGKEMGRRIAPPHGDPLVFAASVLRREFTQQLGELALLPESRQSRPVVPSHGGLHLVGKRPGLHGAQLVQERAGLRDASRLDGLRERRGQVLRPVPLERGPRDAETARYGSERLGSNQGSVDGSALSDAWLLCSPRCPTHLDLEAVLIEVRRATVRFEQSGGQLSEWYFVNKWRGSDGGILPGSGRTVAIEALVAAGLVERFEYTDRKGRPTTGLKVAASN